MKKFMSLALLLILALSLTGCTQGLQMNEPESAAAASEKTDTIVIPKNIVDLADVNIAAQAKAVGIEGIEQGDDGALVYRVSPEDKERLVSDMQDALLSYIEGLPSLWPFITEIAVNESFDTVTITSTKEAYHSERDDKVAAALYSPVLLYRSFAELTTPEDFTLQVLVVNSSDDSQLAEINYPAAK